MTLTPFSGKPGKNDPNHPPQCVLNNLFTIINSRSWWSPFIPTHKNLSWCSCKIELLLAGFNHSSLATDFLTTHVRQLLSMTCFLLFQLLFGDMAPLFPVTVSGSRSSVLIHHCSSVQQWLLSLYYVPPLVVRNSRLKQAVFVFEEHTILYGSLV